MSKINRPLLSKKYLQQTLRLDKKHKLKVKELFCNEVAYTEFKFAIWITGKKPKGKKVPC